ncbi:MAG: hypothetical protein EHM61_12795 [Acidobacteria bacterium]|nr:MAG: hypothetical protein EHM61_12795 [Acidobacteriota bacterium]
MWGVRYRYLVTPSYASVLEAAGVQDAASLHSWSAEGDCVSQSSTSETRRQALGNLLVYVKRRFYEPASWRYLARASRGSCEWANNKSLRQLGIRCPELVCLGEKRRVGRLCWSTLVTREVPDSRNLLECFQDPAFRHGQEKRREVLSELAASLRLLHRRDFVLHDARLRNVLHQEDGEAGCRLYFIDCPRGGYRRFLVRRAVRRDLSRLREDLTENCGEEAWEVFREAYSEA